MTAYYFMRWSVHLAFQDPQFNQISDRPVMAAGTDFSDLAFALAEVDNHVAAVFLTGCQGNQLNRSMVQSVMKILTESQQILL